MSTFLDLCLPGRSEITERENHSSNKYSRDIETFVYDWERTSVPDMRVFLCRWEGACSLSGIRETEQVSLTRGTLSTQILGATPSELSLAKKAPLANETGSTRRLFLQKAALSIVAQIFPSVRFAKNFSIAKPKVLIGNFSHL
jgi:hypothetical protein